MAAVTAFGSHTRSSFHASRPRTKNDRPTTAGRCCLEVHLQTELHQTRRQDVRRPQPRRPVPGEVADHGRRVGEVVDVEPRLDPQLPDLEQPAERLPANGRPSDGAMAADE